MPKPRKQLVSVEATPYYHCISRCVRRAYLCGEDRLSGKSFDHRKTWLVDRMKHLAGIFAIDICAHAVLSNHFHLVLHVDRAKARSWSKEEVMERYEKLFPCTVGKTRELPEAVQLREISVWRERLWDLSWYMRCLNEAIARRANREDKCTGRFWEGRFRSQALLDPGALTLPSVRETAPRSSAALPRSPRTAEAGCQALDSSGPGRERVPSFVPIRPGPRRTAAPGSR